MGKRRKTYKEKLVAELRHKVYSLNSANAFSFDEIKDKFEIKPSSSTDALQNQYPYLLKDISKTGILTLSIIAIQIILFVIVKSNIVSIPGINY